ncbi:hypothetical protein ACLOJK_037195 [Asimina triloba]
MTISVHCRSTEIRCSIIFPKNPSPRDPAATRMAQAMVGQIRAEAGLGRLDGAADNRARWRWQGAGDGRWQIGDDGGVGRNIGSGGISFFLRNDEQADDMAAMADGNSRRRAASAISRRTTVATPPPIWSSSSNRWGPHHFTHLHERLDPANPSPPSDQEQIHLPNHRSSMTSFNGTT